MKIKAIAGIMLTLFLVSTLSMALPVLAPVTGDLNGDGAVDIYDVVIWADAFGTSPGDPKWDGRADLNGDNLIDIFDAVIIAVHFGETGADS